MADTLRSSLPPVLACLCLGFLLCLGTILALGYVLVIGILESIAHLPTGG